MLMHTNHNAELVLWIGSWRQCLSLQKFLAMLSQRTYSGLFICLRTFDDILCEAFVRLFVLFVCCKAIALASLLKQHKVFKFEKIWSSHLPLPCLKWLFCARQVGRLVGNAEGGSLRYPSTPVRGRNPALLCHALLHPAHWVCNAKDPAYPRFAACTERKNEIYGWAELFFLHVEHVELQSFLNWYNKNRTLHLPAWFTAIKAFSCEKEKVNVQHINACLYLFY